MFTVDDVTSSVDTNTTTNCLERLNSVLNARYRYDADTIRSYGTRPIDIDNIRLMESMQSFEQAEATAKYLMRSYQWVQAFLKALPRLVVDSNWDGRFKHSGLDIKFPSNHLSSYYQLSRDAVIRELSEVLTLHPDYNDDPTYLHLVFAEPKLRNEHTGNPTVGIVSRAVWLNKRRNVIRSIRDELSDSYGISISDSTHMYQWDLRLTLGASLSINRINTILQQYAEGIGVKVNASDIYALRSQLLQEQTTRQARIDRLNMQKSGERFTKFWQSIKATNPQPADDAYASWSTIPLADTGTDASRTWGIEIETVRAFDTSRPGGWESKPDGSLQSNCDCDCDDCYNGEHCEYGECEDSLSGREFVSPILDSFNSRGLRHLCGDLGTDPDEDSSPGIHVHVGASDLSVSDVSRLLLNYSIVEKLLEPIYRRTTRNYCRPTTVDTLRFWLQQVRKYRHANPNSVPSPSDLVYESPQDRYSDVNLHALRHHGTIEFRAMGPWYNYDYLIRWAWFVREMVNVSKLGIAQREWTSCQTLDDVIALLRKYGTEMPSNQLFADKSLALHEIGVSEC